MSQDSISSSKCSFRSQKHVGKKGKPIRQHERETRTYTYTSPLVCTTAVNAPETLSRFAGTGLRAEFTVLPGAHHTTGAVIQNNAHTGSARRMFSRTAAARGALRPHQCADNHLRRAVTCKLYHEQKGANILRQYSINHNVAYLCTDYGKGIFQHAV